MDDEQTEWPTWGTCPECDEWIGSFENHTCNKKKKPTKPEPEQMNVERN